MRLLVAVIFAGCGWNGVAAQSPGFFLDGWQARSIAAPAYTDATKPATNPAVTVNVYADSVLTKLCPYLFGNNSNPYMGQMVTEPVLLDHITRLAPHIIRAPGGSLSDVYFFNAADGQPPADVPDSLYDTNGNKVAAYYWYGKNTAGWTLSLDNYYKMLQQTGNTGIITINYAYARYGTGPNPVATAAHLAAEWVRYDGGRTRFWEIGNESSGPWEAGYEIDTTQNQDGQPSIITGTLYGQHFKIFADSMRSAAAETGDTIYIGAQLVGYDAGSSWNPPDRTWNAEYFAAAGNTADFYIVHDYYTPYNENSTVSTILNSAASETRSVMSWMKTTTTNAGVSLRPIALTEWNISAVGSDQMVSHIAGLHADLVLGELMKNKFGMASRWDLANGWSNGNDQGLFNSGDEPGGVAKWNPRPAFYHLYFFQQYFGDRMVASTVSDTSNIVCYASTFSSGQCGLVLVNKGTAAQVVKMDFFNFTPGNRYYWFTLTGGTDNGDFSRQVLVNGNGPSGISGGPDNFASLAANSAPCNNDVVVSVPARASVYMLVEKSDVTAVTDIDPGNKLVRIYPNPSRTGNFDLYLSGFNPGDRFEIRVVNALGQVLYQERTGNVSKIPLHLSLRSGVYGVQVQTPRGITTKTLLVR